VLVFPDQVVGGTIDRDEHLVGRAQVREQVALQRFRRHGIELTANDERRGNDSLRSIEIPAPQCILKGRSR